MTTPGRALELASGRFRRRPLLRRFRERVQALPLQGDYFELRVDMGGLGFEFHGSLPIRHTWEDELSSAHIDRFLCELEEGFVAEYDRHLAKLEAA